LLLLESCFATATSREGKINTPAAALAIKNKLFFGLPKERLQQQVGGFGLER